MHRAVIAVAMMAAILAVAPPPARSQDVQPDDRVLLTADEVIYDDTLGVVTATGHVEMAKGQRVLRADTLSYNRRADLVTASGNVAVVEPSGAVVFAEYVELTGDLKSGAIEGIRILLEDDSRFAAGGGRMTSDGRTELRKAIYSPCDLCPEHPDDPPVWQLKAYEITHDKELRRIFYADAFLEVFGVPVAYVPFFSHPDPTVIRKTGFLRPTFGSDSVLGFIYRQPYFFNISPSQDATFAPIITSDEGPILTGEYRQVLENGSYELSGSVTRVDREPGDPKDTKRTRGHVFAKGDFEMNSVWDYGFDLNRSTDATYLARYNFARGQDFLTSRLYLDGISGRDYASIEALSFQTLDPDVDESTVPFVVPFFNYDYKSEPDSIGGYWLFNANTMVLSRTEGPKSRRLSLGGGWRLPVTTSLGDRYALTVSLRGDGYHVEDVPDPQNPPTGDQNGFTGRLIPQVELEWRFPFARTRGTMHQVIEPIAQVIFAPNGLNSSKIPNEDSLDFEFDDINLFSANRFTGYDRVEGGLRVNYGLRLAANGAGGGRSEFLIGQTYRVRDDDTFQIGTGLSDNQSDFVGRLTVAPSEYLDLSYRFRLDQDNLAVRRASLAMVAGPEWLQGRVDYTKLSDEPTKGIPNSVEQLNVSGRLELFENWSLLAFHQRDLTAEGGSLLTGANLTYQDDCVLVRLGVSRNFTQNADIEPSTNFTIDVQLLHLG